MEVYDQFKALGEMRELLIEAANDTPSRKKQRATLLAALADYKATFEWIDPKKHRADDVDAVTAPTALYEPEFTYELGDDPQQPAVTMTQYAARQYTKWLSGLSGRTYRLPSEAEWEHACRAGATTAYSFGDDPKQLGDYAWCFDNSEGKPQNVGQKKPNPWGLYDVHGNVGEWVLDELAEGGYAKFGGKTLAARDAIVWPTRLFPRVIRGGSFDGDPKALRCAARLGSNDKAWHDRDPNEPKSPWWLTEKPARGVGFRILRTLAEPSADERQKWYEADVDSLRADVAARLDEGRGVKERVGRALAEILTKLDDVQKKREALEKKK
jgi:formylglycine-generating enzyme required for sulfatase activity